MLDAYPWTAVTEVNPTEDLGFYQHGRLALVRDGAPVVVEVAGMTRRLASGDGNVAATDGLAAMARIASAFERMAEARLD